MIKNLILLSSLLLTAPLFAQEEVAEQEVNVDDLGNVNDEFKETFFNALAEKGKQNHDRAITLLERCLELQPSNAAVLFELGKNHLSNNAFAKAEDYLLRAIDSKGENEWLLDTLLEVYQENNDQDKALETLKKLVAINENYEELLPLQYIKTGQPDKALEVLEGLDKRIGESANRNLLKRQLRSQFPGKEPILDEQALLDQIEQQPENEEAYIKLIYLYGKQNESDKMLQIAAQMEENLPQSDKAQLALYKIYFDQGMVENGMESMQRIFESDEFDLETKIKVLNDFIQVENVDATDSSLLEKAITNFSAEVDDTQAMKVLGDYYLKRKDPSNAIAFYEKGLETNPDDYDLIKNVALLSIDLKDYDRVENLTSSALELYPAQPLLYLLNAIAQNHLENYDDAIMQLEMGLSYLIDEPKMEQDIYQQLARAYEKKGNTTKAAEMRSKAEALSKT
ncbi:hypothetical protein BST97_10110 [Nonlabens spongiae]|uniref:Tetratricopeptide repeat protein n=1 Tax=Nonlabens spongiae TaxID=331648 RepID=A0A1W6ML48_9FLAO|nr:tetratricopeptide repeat protein [Nonlabens spongiae]ARN78313.1 hypothetical protein BST97_10110 [Nonlabens spongiae]